MRPLLAVLFAVLTSAAANADFIIDDFNAGGNGTVTFNSLGVQPVYSSSGLGAGTVGGRREWRTEVLQQSTKTEVIDILPNYLGIDNVFVVDNGSGQRSETILRWDGDLNTFFGGALGEVDVSQGNTNNYLVLSVLTSDLATNFRIDVTDHDSTFGLSTIVGGPTTQFIGFSDFTGIDFTRVNAFQLTITGPASYDVVLGNFAAVTAVPEPSSILFVATAAAGLGFARRRRKS